MLTINGLGEIREAGWDVYCLLSVFGKLTKFYNGKKTEKPDKIHHLPVAFTIFYADFFFYPISLSSVNEEGFNTIAIHEILKMLMKIELSSLKSVSQ